MLQVIELNGQILTQSYAILRHFARQLGAYDGKTEEEKYFADRICDIVIDCTSPRFLRDAWLTQTGRTLFITAFFSDNKDQTHPEHCMNVRLNFLKAINTYLESSDFSSKGPFICGGRFTYADMVLY